MHTQTYRTTRDLLLSQSCIYCEKKLR